MSFKREGDDQYQLNLLKKRRVSDLLAEDIPEDEAFLMSSGRYACTVCCHRPVFDTIAMLLVHRNGKKHHNNVKNYYAKKQDFMKEVEKRKQLLHLKNLQEGKSTDTIKTEDVAPLLAKTRQATHHALLKAAPYKGYRTLKIKQDADTNSKTLSKSGDSFFQRVLRNSHLSSTDLQDKRLTQHSDSSSRNVDPSSETQTKDLDCALSSDRRKGSSEVSRTRHPVDGNSSQYPGDVGNKFDQSNSANLQSLDVPLTVIEKRQPALLELKPYVPKHLRNERLVDLNTEQSFSERAPSPNQSHLEGSSTSTVHVWQTLQVPRRKLVSRERNPRKSEGDAKKSYTVNSERERFLKLTSSGWKTDWQGGWIQDPDVEFDSDEETPS